MTPRAWKAKLTKAARHLALAEPTFARLVGLIGPCTLVPEPDPFAATIRAVIAQQISTPAARTITSRLEALLPAGLTAPALLALDDEAQRGCGLSGPKRRTLRAVCEAAAAGQLTPAVWPDLSDNEIAGQLLPVKGVGPWTVQMVLIFALGRLDVWPVGDLGVRFALRDELKLVEAPTPEETLRLGEPWRPYRTVAAWYLWRSRGFVPHSGIA